MSNCTMNTRSEQNKKNKQEHLSDTARRWHSALIRRSHVVVLIGCPPAGHMAQDHGR